MLVAMQHLSAGWQAAFFIVAVALFVLAALRGTVSAIKTRVDLVALGLAAFVFVFAWNALAANG